MARSLAASHARFSVGCHVVLLDGEPLLPADRVGSLLQPGAKNGSRQFRVKLNDFVIASFRNQLNPAEIEAEASAQIPAPASCGGAAVSLRHPQACPHVSRRAAAAAASGAGVWRSGRAQSIWPGVAIADRRSAAQAHAVAAFRRTECAAQLCRQVPPRGRGPRPAHDRRIACRAGHRMSRLETVHRDCWTAFRKAHGSSSATPATTTPISTRLTPDCGNRESGTRADLAEAKESCAPGD